MTDCTEYELCGCAGAEFDLHCMMCCRALHEHPRWVRQALRDKYLDYRGWWRQKLFGYEYWVGVTGPNTRHVVVRGWLNGGLFDDLS